MKRERTDRTSNRVRYWDIGVGADAGLGDSLQPTGQRLWGCPPSTQGFGVNQLNLVDAWLEQEWDLKDVQRVSKIWLRSVSACVVLADRCDSPPLCVGLSNN